MKVKKILNNNAIIVHKEQQDFIWIGTGLGFNKKPGDSVEEDKVEKVFTLQSKSSQHFSQLLENIPVKYATLADDIIKLAKNCLPYQISDAIYVSLTDHLYNVVKMKTAGVILNNQLFWEIKKFYPKEFSIGLQAIGLMKKCTKVTIEESEACNIALHFINAQINYSDNQNENIVELTKQIKDIVAIIRMHNKITINEQSLTYERFVTHLRFFFKRLESKERLNDVGNPLLVHVVEKYPAAYETTQKVAQYLQSEFSDDEQLYITLHIQKLIEDQPS
ncbi:PRD domain-containing protein [Enterococcus faecalis]